MEEKTGSMNINPKEALTVKVETRPENLMPVTTVSSFTNRQETEARQPESPDPLFGKHITEAAAIVKDWWEEKQSR